MKKSRIITLGVAGIVLLLSILSFVFLGVFVVQPIGALPEGVTVVYVRSGLNLPFIASADGILLEETGNVSLFSRTMMLGSVFTLLKEKEVVRLPYLEFLYSISTNGVKLEK